MSTLLSIDVTSAEIGFAVGSFEKLSFKILACFQSAKYKTSKNRLKRRHAHGSLAKSFYCYYTKRD